MNRSCYVFAFVAVLVASGCGITSRRGDFPSDQAIQLRSQVESILFDLHANTNDTVEAKAIETLDALQAEAA